MIEPWTISGFSCMSSRKPDNASEKDFQLHTMALVQIITSFDLRAVVFQVYN